MVGLDVGSQQQQSGLAACSNGEAATAVGMQQVSAVGANQPPQALGQGQHPPSHTTQHQTFQHHMAPLPPPPKMLQVGLQQPAASNSSSMPSSAMAGPGGQMPHPTQQPREFLETVFDQVVATDKEGYFLFPVSETQAPGYYNVIKNPLCFKDMRMKLAADAYTSWRSLMADFELIINNAKTFNSSKTKCHRCALQLQKNVNKIMSLHELDVRRALGVLQSQAGGPAGSTPPGTLLPPPLPPATTAAAAIKVEQQGAVPTAQPAAAQAPRTPVPQLLSTALQPAHADAMSSVYSDNEDIDHQVAQHHQQLRGGTGPMQLHRAPQPVPLEALMAQLRTPVVFQSWGSTSAAPGDTAAGHATLSGTLSTLAGAGAQTESTQHTGQGPTDTLDKLKGTGTVASTSLQDAQPAGMATQQLQPEQHHSFSRDWKRARRSLQWQSRWLELRMLELQAQIARMNRDSQAQQQPGSTVAPQGQEQQQAEASSSTAAHAGTGMQTCKAPLVAAVPRILHGQHPPPLKTRHPTTTRLRITFKSDAAAVYKQQPALQQRPSTQNHAVQPSGGLGSTPFFAGAHKQTSSAAGREALLSVPDAAAPLQNDDQGDVVMADAKSDGPQQVTANASQPQRPAAVAQQGWELQPVLGGVANSQLPAAVHAALECLELQLSDIKRGLQTTFALDRGPGARARAGAARPGAFTAQAGTAALKRQASTHKGGAAGVHRAASHAVLAAGKLTSLESIKRKRTESDADGQLSPNMSGRLQERNMPVQPSSIFTPQVHEISIEEQAARIEASTTWAAAYAEQGATALSHPPPAVAASLAAAPEEEGSSSEDSSEEAYVAMHAIMAEEERKRFEAYAAEGQRRRNKQSSKHGQGAAGAADKQGQGTGHGPIGRRASGAIGPKTTANAAAAAHRANALLQRQQSQQLLAPPPPSVNQPAEHQQPAATAQMPGQAPLHKGMLAPSPPSASHTFQVAPQPPAFHAASLQQSSQQLQVEQQQGAAGWQQPAAVQESSYKHGGHTNQHGAEPPRSSGNGVGPSHSSLESAVGHHVASRPNGMLAGSHQQANHHQNHHGTVFSGQPGTGAPTPPLPPVQQLPYPQPPAPAPPPPPLKQAAAVQHLTGTQKRTSASGSAPAPPSGSLPAIAQRPPRRAAAVAAAAAIAVHPAGHNPGAHHQSGGGFGGSISSRSSTGLPTASDCADGTDSARLALPNGEEEDSGVDEDVESGAEEEEVELEDDGEAGPGTGDGGDEFGGQVPETDHMPFQGRSEGGSQGRSRSHSRSRSVSSGCMHASSPEPEAEQGNGSVGGAQAGHSSAEPAIKATGNTMAALQEHARKQKAAAAELPTSNGKTRSSKERNGRRTAAGTSPRMTRSQDMGKTRSSTNGLLSGRAGTTRAQQAMQTARRRS